MRIQHPAVALALSLPLLAAGTAAGAELTVFVTGSMADPLERAAHDFTSETGHALRFERATTGGLLTKIRAGERGDVIVIAAEAAATANPAPRRHAKNTAGTPRRPRRPTLRCRAVMALSFAPEKVASLWLDF